MHVVGDCTALAMAYSAREDTDSRSAHITEDAFLTGKATVDAGSSELELELAERHMMDRMMLWTEDEAARRLTRTEQAGQHLAHLVENTGAFVIIRCPKREKS